ncbi:MAG: response regulator [Phormidesmis sp.]
MHHFLIVDDHEAILEGTIPAIQQEYPDVTVVSAQHIVAAEDQLALHSPELVIVDLSLPEKAHTVASPEVGIQFLIRLMESELSPNIVVLSTNVQPVIQLKPMINTYEGGFAVMDKSMPIQDMLRSINMALRGSIYLPPAVRARPEFDRKWIQVLKLKYQEGYSDKAIAKKMDITDRTVRNYWVRIQDALRVYEDPDKDLRAEVQIAARKAGFIS